MEQLDIDSLAWMKIKCNLYDFFNRHGVAVRMIYRTCHAAFRNESPHNLIPGNIYSDRMTIFISFVGIIDPGKIDFIVAFLEKDAGQLPRQQESRFHVEKIDINNLQKMYLFKDIKDLVKNYSRLLKNFDSVT